MAIANPMTSTIETLRFAQPVQTTLIPVSNPNTVAHLLDVAQQMMCETGGRMVVLSVVTDDTPDELKSAAVRSVLDAYELDESRFSAQLVTYVAPDIVTGIIDAAHQYHADKILLGLNYAVRGQVELGIIAETVAERAPCDVVVHRSPAGARIDRVIVPVGGSIASRVILEIGVRLGQGYGVPVEALHVYNDISDWEARAHVESLLAHIPGHENVKVQVVRGINEANSVLSRTNEHDLMVVGFSERSMLAKWLYGDTAQRILDRAPGPVLVVSRAIDDAEVQALARRRLSWLRPLLTEQEQQHVIWLAKDTVLPTLDYAVLLVIAAVLAALGLLLNSSAVVIGAMLVAPLMQPIIALGIGLCTARLNLMRKAVVTIGLSVTAALLVGVVCGLLIMPNGATKEMLARAYPSLLDAAVAAASGFIGAYATARKDIPAALAGVAIAAALVPPICTVGLSLAIGEPRLAMGAALLFVANMVCITIVAAAVFYWMGMRPTRLDTDRRRRRYTSILVTTAMVLLLVGALLDFSRHPSVEKISQTSLQTIFEPAELTGLQITRQDPLVVVATVRTVGEIPPETVKLAQVRLSEDLDTPVRLRVIPQRVIDGQ